MSARALAALAVLVTAVACSGTSTPTSPAGATLTALAITGLPADISVDDRTQLAASAGYSDGRIENVTARVRWSSGSLRCIVDNTGLVTALSEGECRIEAALDDARAVAAATVGPSRVFTISGFVRERWGVRSPGMPGSVTIVSGAQAGRRIATNADGSFSMAGVPREPVQLRADADGYEPRVTEASPADASVEFMMEPFMRRIYRQFLNDGVFDSVPFEQTFTVSRRGPVTVRARSDGTECGTYETYGMVLTGPSVPPGTWVYGCPRGVWAERTLMLDPGQYKVAGFYTVWPWTTARREMELLFPE